MRGRLHALPPAAQGAVELNDSEPARGLEAGESVFSRIKLLLRFEDFVVAGLAFFVTGCRQLDGLASGADGLRLLDSAFFKSATRDERVRHFAEGGERR